jgi:hypothetical protein
VLRCRLVVGVEELVGVGECKEVRKRDENREGLKWVDEEGMEESVGIVYLQLVMMIPGRQWKDLMLGWGNDEDAKWIWRYHSVQQMRGLMTMLWSRCFQRRFLVWVFGCLLQLMCVCCGRIALGTMRPVDLCQGSAEVDVQVTGKDPTRQMSQDRMCRRSRGLRLLAEVWVQRWGIRGFVRGRGVGLGSR